MKMEEKLMKRKIESFDEFLIDQHVQLFTLEESKIHLFKSNKNTIHEDIIVKALKIKTKYLCADVVGMDAIAEVVESMMMEAYRSNVVIKPEKFGNLLGTNHKLISDNKADIGDDAIELDNLSTKIYLSQLDTWQVPYALIKIHTTLFNNSAIAIQTKVNGTAINFYGTEFETAEPSLSLAVKSFVDYVASGVKK